MKMLCRRLHREKKYLTTVFSEVFACSKETLFIVPFTHSILKHITMHTCPLCTSTKSTTVGTSYNRHGRHDIERDDTFTLLRCEVCNLIFLGGVKINNAYYKKYYDAGYYPLSTFLTKLLDSWSFTQKEKILLMNAPKRKHRLKILDVGCGSGKFLESLDGEKFEKYGIEIKEEGIKLSRQKGFTVYEKDVTKIDFGKKKFDIITLWHVLEHLVDPVSVYNKINEILAVGGIVVFATPNTDSLGFRIGNKLWFHLDSPRHLMLFNRKSIQLLCEKTGLTIKSIKNEWYDYPLDLFWSVKHSPYKYLIYLFYPIIKFFDNEALTVICKKQTSLRASHEAKQ